jgi:protein translocase SecG subunit
MALVESVWFATAFLIIIIVILIDPKSSVSGFGKNTVLSIFSSPSSGQSFIYRLSALFIIIFYISTILLSYFA